MPNQDARERFPPLVSALLATPLFALAGCADSGPGPAAGVVRDSAGVEIVENGPLGSGGGAAGWTVSPQPVLRLGGVDAEGPEQFTRVGHLTRLGGGEIVVFERSVSELRFFSAGGEHLRTAGGRGEGPGEFGFAGDMVRTRADTLLVRDVHGFRRSLVVFSPSGDYVRQERLDVLALRARFTESALGCATHLLLGDGSFLTCIDEPGVTRYAEGTPARDERANLGRGGHRIVRVSWDLSRIDTLGVILSKEDYVHFPGPELLDVKTHAFFSDGHLAAGVDPLLLYVANNPDYSIEVWTPEGALKRIVRRVGEGARRRPTSEEEAAAWEAFVEEWDIDDLPRWRRELPVPDTLPAVRGLVVGSGGELWVQREPVVKRRGRALLDLFDGEGRYLGEVRVPSPLFVKEVGEDYLLGVRYDEFDVPFVEMYALRRGG